MATPNINLPSFLSWKLIRVVAVIFLLFIVFKSIFVFIPPGYVGAVYDRGRGVLPNPIREGLNIVIPFWQSVEYFDARLQEYTMSSVKNEGAILGDDSLDAPTSDGQTVKVDATVLFKVDKDKVAKLYQEVGWDFLNKLIRPISRSQIRMVISRYSATEIYSEKRQEAETVMTKEIAELLSPKYIIVDRVLLRGVNFSPEYSQAIEQKVIAEQKVKEAEFRVKQATQEAQAKIAEAKGLAEAQALQKANLTQEYLQLEAIKKWDGKLPTYNGTGGLPFLSLPLAR